MARGAVGRFLIDAINELAVSIQGGAHSVPDRLGKVESPRTASDSNSRRNHRSTPPGLLPDRAEL